MYSPETCVYVPYYINYLIVGNNTVDQIGVSPEHTKRKDGSITTTYRAYCNNGKGKSLRHSFKTLEDANEWYVETKKTIVREVASKAMEHGEISQKVYDALISRKFS